MLSSAIRVRERELICCQGNPRPPFTSVLRSGPRAADRLRAALVIPLYANVISILRPVRQVDREGRWAAGQTVAQLNYLRGRIHVPVELERTESKIPFAQASAPLVCPYAGFWLRLASISFFFASSISRRPMFSNRRSVVRRRK